MQFSAFFYLLYYPLPFSAASVEMQSKQFVSKHMQIPCFKDWSDVFVVIII